MARHLFPHQRYVGSDGREEDGIRRGRDFDKTNCGIDQCGQDGSGQSPGEWWSPVACEILAFLILGQLGKPGGEERSFSAVHVAARGLASYPEARTWR